MNKQVFLSAAAESVKALQGIATIRGNNAEAMKSKKGDTIAAVRKLAQVALDTEVPADVAASIFKDAALIEGLSEGTVRPYVLALDGFILSLERGDTIEKTDTAKAMTVKAAQELSIQSRLSEEAKAERALIEKASEMVKLRFFGKPATGFEWKAPSASAIIALLESLDASGELPAHPSEGNAEKKGKTETKREREAREAREAATARLLAMLEDANETESRTGTDG